MLNPEQNGMPDLQFNLTLEDTNLILEALGELPFVRVHQLISKMQQQAHSQLQAAQTTSTLETLSGSQDER